MNSEMRLVGLTKSALVLRALLILLSFGRLVKRFGTNVG